MNLKKFLFENESVVGISTPSQYIYIKIVRFMLVIVGSWPRREMGEPEPRHETIMINSFFFCVVNAALYGSISYVCMHTSELSFLEVGHMYIVILMSAIDMSRVFTLTYSQRYRDLAKEFLTKIHLFFFKDRSPYAMLTHKKVHLICHLFSLCLLSQMLTGLSLFNLIPMYTNYASGRYSTGGTQNSTFEHSLYFPYPFNTSSDINGYVVACILHWLLSYFCSTWFCMFDLFLSIMVFHLWGHFKILINSLNNFPKPSAETRCELEKGFIINADKYSKEELVEVSQKLKECIDYHREIVQFTNAMSDVFGPMLFCYYIFHQTSGCLLLLECSQMTAQALIRYVPLTIILTQQLIQLSVIFELVGSESEKLKDAVYGVPWECMDANNRKVVAFFLMNVQEPVHIKALGVANVGVTSMAAILKTSMSYFTFLRSMGITAPTDYLYVKLLRMTLRVIATWPQREMGEKEPVYLNNFLKYFYLVVTIGCQFGSYLYLRAYNDELTMMEAGHNYLMIMMTFIDISRIISLTFSTEYRKICKEFFTKMHLFYFKNVSEYAMETHKRVHLLSHLFTLWLLFQMVFGVIFFNLIPMYYNYTAGRYKPGGTQNSTFEHSLYYKYPFDTLTEVKGYIVANIINWILSCLCVTWFCMCDLILSLMVFNIWGHLKMLTHTLHNFPRPSLETSITIDGGITVTSAKYSEEESVQILDKLKECVNYHRRIVEFNSKVSDVFGPMLICYYLYHQTSGCLLLLECSQMTAPVLMRYLPLTIVCTQQLIQLSVIFELIGTESEKLPDAVYSVPWECMDTSNRKFVIFFLMNVKEPIAVKPLGIANVGVTTMAAILRTSLSYFTFLRSI